MWEQLMTAIKAGNKIVIESITAKLDPEIIQSKKPIEWLSVLSAINTKEDLRTSTTGQNLCDKITNYDEIISIKDASGNTALYYASEGGYPKVVAKLFKAKAALLELDSMYCNNTRTMLHRSAELANDDVSLLLISKMSKEAIEAKHTQSGLTALHLATMKAHPKVVDAMLDKMSKQAIEEKCQGKNALHLAAERGDAKLTDLLLHKMSQPAIDEKAEGKTALHIAAERGYFEVVKLLLSAMSQQAINENIQNKNALHLAITKNSVETVQLLLGSMSKQAIEHKDAQGNNILFYAVNTANVKMIELILNKGSQKVFDNVNNEKVTSLNAIFDLGDNSVDLQRVTKMLIFQMSQEAIAVTTQYHENIKQSLGKIISSFIHSHQHYASDPTSSYRQKLAIINSSFRIIALLDELIKENPDNSELYFKKSNILFEMGMKEESAQYQKQASSIVSSKLEQEKVSTLEDPADRLKRLIESKLDGKNVKLKLNAKLIDLEKGEVPEKEVESLVKSVMAEGGKPLAIFLHLHDKVWASMMLKNQDDDLRIIYNDHAGHAYTEEKNVQALIASITKQNHSDTPTTDLRQDQQNTDTPSEVIFIENIVCFATAKITRKAELIKLLPTAEYFQDLQGQQLLLKDTNPLYSDYKFKKLLEIALKDAPVKILPATVFDNVELLLKSVKTAVQTVISDAKAVLLPLHVDGSHWSGLIFKLQADGALQVVYNNPKGTPFIIEKNALLLMKTMMEINPDIHILDIGKNQQNNDKDSGVFTVDNLARLAKTDTSKFTKLDFAKLLAAEGEASNIRLGHIKLLQQEGILVAMPDDDSASHSHVETFEHIGILPPPYHPNEDDVQLSGNNSLSDG